MHCMRPGFVSRFPARRWAPALCLAAALLPLASPAAGADPCISANGSNFNGTPIAGGNFIWFAAVARVKGFDASAGTSLRFTASTIRFTAGATTYELDVPENVITFSPTATEASTSFDGVAWTTIVPSSFSQDVFLSGLPFQVPAGGLPGGINPVTWSGRFVATSTGVTVEWKWGAAVYSQFSLDSSLLGVKPVSGGKSSPYPNSDHAGTPENFKPYVTGGARGGGGSNWTGSWSGTDAVAACSVEVE